MVSDETGKIVECNRYAAHLLELTPQEQAARIIGSREWNFIRSDGSPMPQQEHASSRALAEDRLVENVAMGVVKGDRSVVWTDVNAAPIPLEDHGVAIALRDVTAHRNAERELEGQRQKLRELADELTCTEERLRRDIAVSLHDGIGQMLSMMKMKLRQAESTAESPGQERELAGIRKIAENALSEARSLSFELAPPLLYDAGLVPALGWLVKKFQHKHPHVLFHLKGQWEPPDLECRILFFQFARELLANAATHAKARNVGIQLQSVRAPPSMRIWDDGVGGVSAVTIDSFRPERGFGLFSIRERIKLRGGDMAIDSPPNGGTAISLWLPPPPPGLPP